MTRVSKIRHVRTSNGVSTYKVADDKTEAGEATVVVTREESGAEIAHCVTCSRTERHNGAGCAHAKRIYLRLQYGA